MLRPSPSNDPAGDLLNLRTKIADKNRYDFKRNSSKPFFPLLLLSRFPLDTRMQSLWLPSLHAHWRSTEETGEIAWSYF